jgi:signal transduction histidine kinase
MDLPLGELAQLAEEQASSQRVEAALRRVAQLVAGGAPPEELFAAVTEEAGRLLQAGQTTMIRYEADGTVTLVAAWSGRGEAIPLGAREGALQLWIRDDGTGGADPDGGSGLVGLKDRVEALGGTITIHSPPGAGTCMHAKLPLAR